MMVDARDGVVVHILYAIISSSDDIGIIDLQTRRRFISMVCNHTIGSITCEDF
jgi:hypothetical protein